MKSPEYKNLPPLPTNQEVFELGAAICQRDGDVVEYPGNGDDEGPFREYVIDRDHQLDTVVKFNELGIQSITYRPSYLVGDMLNGNRFEVKFRDEQTGITKTFAIDQKEGSSGESLDDFVSETYTDFDDSIPPEGLDRDEQLTHRAIKAIFEGPRNAGANDSELAEEIERVRFLVENSFGMSPSADDVLAAYDALNWLVERHI